MRNGMTLRNHATGRFLLSSSKFVVLISLLSPTCQVSLWCFRLVVWIWIGTLRVFGCLRKYWGVRGQVR